MRDRTRSKRETLILAIQALARDENALADIALNSAGECPVQEEFDDAYDRIEHQLKGLLATLNAAVPANDEQTPEQRETLHYILRFAREAGAPVSNVSAFADFVIKRRDEEIDQAIKDGEKPPERLESEAVRKRFYRLRDECPEVVDEFNQPGTPASEVFAHIIAAED